MEEEYVGEGQAEDSIASETSVAKVCSTLNNTISEADIIDALFDNCDVEKKGYIQISKVINYLKNTSIDADHENEEDFEELWLMFDKGFDDASIDLETFRQVMREYIARNRSRKDRMSSYTEMIGNDEKLLLGSPCPPHVKHIGGFLELSDIVNCSFGSLEGRGGDISNIPDSLQLIVENEDLKLQAKNLQEKYCKQDAFVAQLEEQAAQQQIQFEIQEKQLISLLDKNTTLQQTCEDWQRQLEHCEDEEKSHKEYIKRLEHDCDFLDAQTKQFEAELAQISVELGNLKESKKELLHLMSLQKALFEESEVKNSLQEQKIKLQASSADTVQEYINELQEQISGLRCDNRDLKNSLVETQDELLSLQKRMSATSGRVQKRSSEDDKSDFYEQRSSKRTFHKEVLLSLRNPPMYKSLSLGEELRQVVAENGDRPLFSDKPETSDWDHLIDSPMSIFTNGHVLNKAIDTLDIVVSNEDFLSLWKILIDVTEAEHQAHHLADTLECSWNRLTSIHHSDQCRVSCHAEDTNCSLSNKKNGNLECLEQDMECDQKGTTDIADMKTSLESQGIPVDVPVDLVKESICKEVKTLRIHLARSQAVLAVLMRSMEEAKIQSSSQTPFVAYNCQRHFGFPHSSPMIGSRSSPYNRTLPGRRHFTMKNISLDTGGTATSTPSHRAYRRRTLSCPNFSHLTRITAVEAVANTEFEETCPAKTVCVESGLEEEQLSSPESLRNRSHSFLVAIKKGKSEKPLIVDEVPDTGPVVASSWHKTVATSSGNLSVLREEDPEDCGHLRSPLAKSLPPPPPYRHPPPPYHTPHQRRTSYHSSRSLDFLPGASTKPCSSSSIVRQHSTPNSQISAASHIKHQSILRETPSSTNRSAVATGGYMHSNSLPAVCKVPKHPSTQTDVCGDVEEDPSDKTWARGSSISRRRQRGSPGSPNCIQRCAAVDFDETEAEPVICAPSALHPTAMSLERMSSQTSETESAKGFRVMDQDPAIEVISPNFNDGLLRRLNVHKESEKRIDTLSEPELEAKFQSLCLAAKTDKLTVSKRTDLHQRQRDIAEKNVESELKSLQSSIEVVDWFTLSVHVFILDGAKELRQLSLGANAQQTLEELQNHLAVLQLSTSRLSSRAEVFGAVQQEARVCKAVEVMVTYVEGVRRLYDSVQRELEQARRLLSSNCALMEDSADGMTDELRYGKIIRTNTLFGSQRLIGGGQCEIRRASLTCLPRNSGKLRPEFRSRSLQISSPVGRRRFSMDTMPISQLRFGQYDMDLRSVRDSSSSLNYASESKQNFHFADDSNKAVEDFQSTHCQGFVKETNIADVSKISSGNGNSEPNLLYMRFPRSCNSSLIWSPVVALGQTRIIIGGLLLLVVILSMMLKTFASRLLLVPDAASTSMWDILMGEMFKPSITRNQHSTQPI